MNETPVKLWVLTELFEVKRVDTYDRTEHNGTAYWVPKLGYTLHLSYQLFRTAEEAVEKGLKKIEVEIQNLEEKREDLKAFRVSLTDPENQPHQFSEDADLLNT